MQPIGAMLGDMIRPTVNKGDYCDSEGYLVCGNCNTRKEYEITLPNWGGERNVSKRYPIPCECRKEAIKAEDERAARLDFKYKMERLRRDGITDSAYLGYTFDKDDRRDPRVSDVCQKYVEEWDGMRADNIGILFYGGVGTGKTFLACCIANALFERLVSASVTSFPRLLNLLQSFSGSRDEDSQSLADRLQRYSLLVIDDLGTERNTPYGAEQVFNIVDTRARSGKPLIITTNLTAEDLKNDLELSRRRIYDRILEMCPIHLKVNGEPRRGGNANAKRDKARKLLGIGH